MRPVGTNIRNVCAIMAQNGLPMTYRQVHEQMNDTCLHNISKYCNRAVGLGLATISRDTKPHQFQVVAGWRERAETFAPRPPIRKELPAGRMVNSVWALGE